jgi:hypothetical protein
MDVDYSGLIDQGIAAGVDRANSSPDVKHLTAAMASGASLGGAIGSVFPGIGNLVGGVVGGIAGAVSSLIPLIAGAFKGQCTLTIKGLDTDCRDYPRNVSVAATWIKNNQAAALHLSPEAFSAQAHILGQDFAEWLPTISPDYQGRIRDSGAQAQLVKLPGSRSLLRVAQLPAAAALAAATPGASATHRQALARLFPALSGHDVESIAQKAKVAHDRAVALPRPAPPPKSAAHPSGPAPHPVASPPRDVRPTPPAVHPEPLPPVVTPPVTAAEVGRPSRAAGGGVLFTMGAVGVGLLLLAARAPRPKVDTRAARAAEKET